MIQLPKALQVLLILPVAGLLCFPVSSAGDDDPAKVIEDLYGDRLRAVAATVNRDDDIELAKYLLAAVESLKEQSTLTIAVAEKAAELASKDSSGLDTAIKALDLAAAIVAPEKAGEIQDRAMALRLRALGAAHGEERKKVAAQIVTIQLSYAQQKLDAGDAAGAVANYRTSLAMAIGHRDDRVDALRVLLEAAVQRHRAEQHLLAVQSRLLENRGDKQATDDLVRLCMVDLNDPARAKPLLSVLDGETRRLLTLAMKPINDLEASDARDLGEWCRALAVKAPPAARFGILTRAHDAYTRFLALHDEADLAGASASLIVKELEADLKAAPPDPLLTKPGERKVTGLWRELTARLIKEDQWQINSGRWSFKDNRISGQGDSGLQFKHELPKNFTLEFKMNVVKGMRPRIHFHGLDFSVANEGFSKTIWVYGDGVTNVQGSRHKYENGQEMQFLIRFHGHNVLLEINGKPVMQGQRQKASGCTFEIRAGDGWSPGTTEFYDFRITPAE